MSGLERADMLEEVRVEDAVGMVLAHDLTQIIPGSFKGRKYKKGHRIRTEDIPGLLDIGKSHIYVLRLQPGFLHEDEAALRMARATAEGLTFGEPSEGKVSIKSPIFGLAKVNRGFVDAVNELGEIAFSTIHSDTVVEVGQPIAATRAIPLIVDEAKVASVEAMASRVTTEGRPPLEVKPFRALKAGLITTGGEVFTGRIQDKFGPVVKEKLARFGSEVVRQVLVPDDRDEIAARIREFVSERVDLILLTGGMSVDPDDRTPGAIKHAGADIVSYGIPMLPGSMLLMAYLGDTPVMGLPGCVMHDPHTSFDVLLPKVCAGERVERQDITKLGYGGLHRC